MKSRYNKYQGMPISELIHISNANQKEMGLRFWAAFDHAMGSSAQPIALSNKQFAANEPLFIKCCELAGIKPTKRQASKFRNMKGIAREQMNAARAELEKAS